MFEIKTIVKDSDELLREKSEPVKEPISQEDIDFALYLRDYLIFSSKEENCQKYGLRPGVGLAAPQLGVLKRVCAIYVEYFNENDEVEKTVEYAFINPKIISHSQRQAYLLAGEGCLSVDQEHPGYVKRYAFITVSAYDAIQKQYITVKLRGYDAIVAQHEIDHLDGILFYDRIDKNEPMKRIEGALEI